MLPLSIASKLFALDLAAKQFDSSKQLHQYLLDKRLFIEQRTTITVLDLTNSAILDDCLCALCRKEAFSVKHLKTDSSRTPVFEILFFLRTQLRMSTTGMPCKQSRDHNRLLRLCKSPKTYSATKAMTWHFKSKFRVIRFRKYIGLRMANHWEQLNDVESNMRTELSICIFTCFFLKMQHATPCLPRIALDWPFSQST